MNQKDIPILINLFQELTYINNTSDSLKALTRSISLDIPNQIDKNGFFGQIQGPFEKNQDIMSLIKNQCNENNGTDDNIYISKIGIYSSTVPKFISIISLNGKEYSLGQRGILQLEDVYITSIKAIQSNLNNSDFFIDYQYQAIK